MFDKPFSVGNVAVISIEVDDAAGAPADPGQITVRVMAPDGSTVAVNAADIVRDAVGRYRYPLALTRPGRWCYRVETAAPYTGADDGMINVLPSRFTT